MAPDMEAVREWRAVLAALPCRTLGEQDLIYGIHAEISDPDYLGYRHGERHTRNKGCTGPLCKKALRDWQRARVLARHAAYGTTPRGPYARSSELVHIDTLLEPVKAAHDKEFASRRPITSEELQAAELIGQLVA
jgi:hypothetical protein